MKPQSIALHLIFGVALIRPQSVHAQFSGDASRSAMSSSESLQSQVERLETSAGKSMDSSSEVLKELSKNLDAGTAALKAAYGKLDSAIARLKTDFGFQQEANRCSELLLQKKKDVQGLQATDIGAEVQELIQKIQGLEKRLERTNSVISTSTKLMEATKEKVEKWQKFYSQFEPIQGKEEAIQNIKAKVDVEIRDLASKAK
jgi:DNA gyrase/topoisomerase IV subunit A